MNITSIKLLKLVMSGQKETSELLDLLEIKQRHLANVVTDLARQDYLDKKNTIVRLKETPKTKLLRDIAQIADIEKLLYESNEIVFLNMDESITINELMLRSGLSKATVHRSVSDLQSIGVVIKDKDGIRIDQSKESLVLFLKLLKIEREKKYEDNNIEVIYNDNSITLRKAPSAHLAKGTPTGFSLFSDYGIEYNTIHDYFCEQTEDLTLYDVLLHAVYSANYSKNKMELLISIIFYIEHKDKMDILHLRKKSSKLGILSTWLDIESYVRRKPLRNANLFLPWNEFLSKVKLYDIPPEKYTLPLPTSSLFNEINDKLTDLMTIYLFGGENMRIKALKDSTKDCDIIVEHKKDFGSLTQALLKMNYNKIVKTTYTDEDRRLNPSEIFEHKAKSRIDLFTFTVMQELILSSTMMEKADIRDYGKLKVGLLRNEHIFLLKAVANREGDIQDMAALVKGSLDTAHDLQHASFDWDLVWDEILNQESASPTKNFTPRILEQISYLAEQTGIVAPFLDKLKRHVVDMLIQQLIRGGSMPIKEIVELLNGGDITESMIRNRVDALGKAKIIDKYPKGRATYIKLLKNDAFVERELQINTYRLKRYFDWRFHVSRKSSDLYIQKLVNELRELDFKTIGEIDDVVRNSTEILIQYENEEFSKRHFDIVGATRVCIGLHYPKLGKNRSKYFISNFEKYNRIARDIFILTQKIRFKKNE